MSTDFPIFPRGFILATHPVSVPKSFKPGPLLPHFYVHPWLQVAVSGNEDLFVVILGNCVPISGQDEDPASTLLDQLRQGGGYISPGAGPLCRPARNHLRQCGRSEGRYGCHRHARRVLRGRGRRDLLPCDPC